MSDLEQTAIERLKAASDMSLRLFEKPLVITYSGGKDSDVLLHLAEKSGIPFEALHSLTTADAPETVRHVYDTFYRLECNGYGWHISDLLIYDQPRELSEFQRATDPCDSCHAEYTWGCTGCKKLGGDIKRPPQSWCYVEAMKDE